MNDSIKLIRTIGYPSPTGDFKSDYAEESKTLYRMAENNKVGPLYLKRLYELGQLEQFEDLHRKESLAYQSFMDTMDEVVNEFEAQKIDYSMVKTPTSIVGKFSDVDFLLRENEFKKAKKFFEQGGYRNTSTSPNGAEFMHKSTEVRIDIQKNFALRKLVYLSGDVVLENTIGPNKGLKYYKPRPGVEICILAIHALTEQLFILRDFFYLLALFQRIDESEIEVMKRFAKENGLSKAVGTILAITMDLVEEAFEECPRMLGKARKEFPEINENEIAALNNWHMPHRYKTSTLLRVIMEKFHDKSFRRSVLWQLTELKSPHQIKHNLIELAQRQQRETW